VKILNRDFNEFLSKLDEEQLKKFPEGYVDFCKSLMNNIENNPNVFYTATDHIGLRFEKYGELLNIEITDVETLDILEITYNRVSSINSVYKINNFTIEKLNDIIKRFLR
jgi:hypothetical protein